MAAPALCGNPPVGHPAAAFTEDPGPAKAAFDADKLWDRRRLVVRFLDVGDDPWSSFLRAKVASIAPIWSQYADLPMQFVRGDDPTADVTVNFYPYEDAKKQVYDYGSYNSAVGSPSANVTRVRASLNLVFSPDLARPDRDGFGESEFNRLILHEFGHALGLIHEHQRADRAIVWDEDKLREHARVHWGWVKADQFDPVRINVLEPYREGGRFIGTAFDRDSVMMYPYPEGLAWEDSARKIPFSTNRNVALSPGDKVAAATAYPPRGIEPAVRSELKIDRWYDGEIVEAGSVVPFEVRCRANERLKVEVAGMPTLVAWLRNPRPPGPGEPARPPNILGVAEGPGDDGAVTKDVDVPVKDPTLGEVPGSIFLEIRHRWPLRGTGEFRVRVTRAPPGR